MSCPPRENVRRRRVAGLAVALAACLVLRGHAQSPPPQLPPATFRGGTTVVPIDVRVLDKQGRPVTDLTAADFKIEENGAPQEIRHFSREDFASVGSAQAEPPERRTAQTDDLAPRHRRVFLIYLGRGDLMGPSKGIDGVIHLVRDRLLPPDYVAVLAWNRATDFTRDRASTLAALERFKASGRSVDAHLALYFSGLSALSGPLEIPPSIQAEIDAIFAGPDQAPVRTVGASLQASEDRLSDTYDAFSTAASARASRSTMSIRGVDLETFLQSTAQTLQDEGNLYASIEYLRHIEGEKHLIWLTGSGLQRSFSDPVELDRDLGRRAADARVAVNVIRAAGTPYAHFGLQDTGFSAENRTMTFVPGAGMELLLTSQTSRLFAQLTGGRADENRFRNASLSADYIEQASRFQYLLGYYPTNQRLDGKFRNVKVTVARRGLTVLARRGYYARAQPASLDRQGVVTLSRIAAAIAYPGDIGDLRLQAEAKPALAAKAVDVSATLDPSRIGFARRDGQNTASIELAAIGLDRRQRVVGDVRKTVELTLSDDRLAEARRAGIPLSIQVPVTAPADRLKLIVYDYAADLSGSVTLRLSR